MTAPALPDLLDAVRRRPDADAPRMDVADQLERTGHGRLADLVRVQCRLAALSAWHPDRPAMEARGKALAEGAAEEWRHLLGLVAEADDRAAENAPHLGLRRGIPEQADLTPAQLLQRGADLLARAPIAELNLAFDDDDLPDPALDALPGLEFVDGIRTLSLHDSWLPAGVLGALMGAPAWSGLRTLVLGTGVCGQEHVSALASAPRRPALEALELWGEFSGCGDAGVALLARLNDLPLRSLTLVSQEVGDEGLESLAVGPLCRNLRALAISRWSYAGNHYTDAGLTALAGASWLAQLETLVLTGSERAGTTAEGAGTGEGNTGESADTTGDGTAAGATDRGLPDVVRNARSVTRLSLAAMGLGADTLEALMASDCWARLEELTLRGNDLGSGGVELLAAGTRLPDVLALQDCGVDGAGLRALALGPPVKALDLRTNPLSAEDWDACLSTGRLPRAVTLAADARDWPPDLVAGVRARYQRADLGGDPRS